MRKILLPPVVFVLCLFAMIALNRAGMANHTLYTNKIFDVSIGLFAMGIILPIWGARLFRKHDTNIKPYKDPEKIVTSGPFSMTRNPMYLGLLLMLIGAAVRFNTLESFIFPVAFFCVANWWHIPYEEERMAEIFGEEYTEYKSRVRRWL